MFSEVVLDIKRLMVNDQQYPVCKLLFKLSFYGRFLNLFRVLNGK